MFEEDVSHTKWMKRAIYLASLGKGKTSPNPMVGAVILDKNRNLISEGFHHKAGEPHAEAMAFNNLKKDAKGGSMYVNLEPCCHQGKTPPCVDKVISSGIKDIYISSEDPDKRVSGKGIKMLKEAGVKVHLGLCKKESLELNKSFIYRNTTNNAYGVLKWAMSIDGRIALKNGKSKWITNKKSRSLVHSYRSEFDAIIIGGNTLRKDNPLLNTRGLKAPEPIRVVFTKTLDLPEKANMWDCKTAKTIVVYDSSTANEKLLTRIPEQVEVEKLSSDNPKLISQLLAKRGCNKVLWECGPKLATSALKSGCIQEIITFIAPKILGGENCMNPFGDFEFQEMDEVINLNHSQVNLVGSDICVKNFLKLL
ncbi:bifunctional diaminohydroxyphosphoribosylaminopyrimidine deaminase/5-amino-6-(5-phosphoribosylamino)uracil reductase RibD [Prochlorococcus marinus XMU1411]|uniref:bifunctional diaminohydroxyphosphoribosylaminopyrimidine deaminase/5-amino-6-(5-phosphoribosylamino)uracil reductase RibD n=1 Tax=Prochlorococcus marinus TaxID=1219 RepID=UPI001ADA6169|nr:bifunctional diaminohydroxyphosphoribosylaminopyrimidine deaminase/5-amino-6-(5-phosphoribosylamino)uracil reductase RibD [Prochlorococcus marinus]MBO8244254.1 bifunctional diaminohydroxyphosphoribosylaminopyrimidine deaminase/5-amino-6-(5-phosphoribosylamino)uracil reductase RibD [Prochlorococcus marinus XMU1411]MBW3055340.1 riboflavin biosynthesis protein RibD [Prochlorococcus marinus str. MU1411]MCR8537082.1 bifunctional diaminohydroxyphosphoribosylaminopyrimidine deaminase/5-amino-6-(5-ph